MSWSVSGSNANNPLASLQSLWQQQLSASGTQTPSDPLSALLSELNQNGAGGAGLSSNSPAATAAQPTAPQFGPQMLQALLALQSNGPSAQSLASALDGAGNGDPSSAAGGQSSQSSHGHHHHHHGADGSAGTASGGPASNSGSGNATGNNLAQLLQMQAQLVAPAGTQSTVTA